MGVPLAGFYRGEGEGGGGAGRGEIGVAGVGRAVYAFGMMLLLASFALAQEPSTAAPSAGDSAPPTVPDAVACAYEAIPRASSADGFGHVPSTFGRELINRLPVRSTGEVVGLVSGMSQDRVGGVHDLSAGGAAPVYYIDGIRVMTR